MAKAPISLLISVVLSSPLGVLAETSPVTDKSVPVLTEAISARASAAGPDSGEVESGPEVGADPAELPLSEQFRDLSQEPAGVPGKPEPPEPAGAEPCIPSRAVNLAVTKALLRPPTNNPLDSHVYIAGIRCRESGFLRQDFMLQGIPDLQELADNGFEFIMTYFPDLTWSNFGRPAFSSFYLASADLYTGKTGYLWKDGQFHFTVAGFTGQDYLQRTPVNSAVRFELAPREDMRIFEAWYGQRFGREFEVRFGKIYPWVRFASHQTSGIFQNTAFDYPGLFGTTDTTGNFLPYAQTPLGVQFFYTPNTHNQFSLFVGDGKSDPTGGYQILLGDTALRAEEGVEIIAEYAYFNHSKNPLKMPGYYKIGFQANTGRFFDFGESRFTQNGNYGGYITLEQMLYAEKTEIPRSQGLIAFAKGSLAPSPGNIVSFVASGGLTYAGLIPGRDRDMAGIGVAFSRFNPDAADFYAGAAGLQGRTRQAADSETVLEAVYIAQLATWMQIIGSYQYVISPSPLGAFDRSRPTGHVVLLNTRLSF
jgi:porin